VHLLRHHLDHVLARRRLSAYVDGELGARQQARLERHARDYGECGSMLPQLVGVTTALRRRVSVALDRADRS
jgi:hypothetical protein